MNPALHPRGRATERAAGMAPRRFFTTVLTLVIVGLLTNAPAASGQTDPLADRLPDAIPTAWHEAAGLTPLLTAPPPPNPATICVIDTGVTPTPDLDITARWAYDGGTLDDVHATEDHPGHGTLVAHFAAGAVNGWGGAGAFPHGRITSVRVFPREGGASWREYIAAISRCSKLDPNTKVIVISIGGQEIEPGEAEELEAHIQQARNLYDVNVVAAAGNRPNTVDFPARFDATFAVAASRHEGGLCFFSARGSEVDIAAPGCDVEQADARGARWHVAGTSFAAPIVAGALGAVRSYAPQLSAREAENILVASSGSGEPPRLNLTAALRAVGVELRRTAGDVRPVAAPAGRGTHVPSGDPAVPPSSSTSPVRSHRRYARPRLFVRRRAARLVVHAYNRPVGASLQLRLGRRTIMRRSDSLVVRAIRMRPAQCRFISEVARSPWVHLRRS